MFTAADESMFDAFEKEEWTNPSPRKVIDETRSIYKSRLPCHPSNGRWGLPILCDFGEARIGKVQLSGIEVQPENYRSPEVVFQMPWGPPVNIWNVGALVSVLGALIKMQAFLITC